MATATATTFATDGTDYTDNYGDDNGVASCQLSLDPELVEGPVATPFLHLYYYYNIFETFCKDKMLHLQLFLETKKLKATCPA
ncbi:MAG: hypothetical protein ISS69_05405 [Phycisphaerae bacterium]|nr:hypothetical protein [Phycisphaerae bacterium]